MLSVVVANLFSHLVFSHSLFDEQPSVSIDVSVGRTNLALIEQSMAEIVQTNFLKISPNDSVRTIDLLKKEQQTEAYCVAEDGTYVGKLFLPQLLELKPHAKVGRVVSNDTIIPASASLLKR